MTREPIRSVEEFLAHALAIEREAMERYREFQACFAEREEDMLAGLCNNLAHFEERHFEQLVERSKGLTLPVIPGYAYRWLEARSPEALPPESLYRIATPRHLLEIALAAEHRARDFFDSVARSAADPQVVRMAGEMAREEDEHVAWVSRALDYLPSGGGRRDLP